MQLFVVLTNQSYLSALSSLQLSVLSSLLELAILLLVLAVPEPSSGLVKLHVDMSSKLLLSYQK